MTHYTTMHIIQPPLRMRHSRRFALSIALAVMAMAPLAATAAKVKGSGPVTTETRVLEPFEELGLAISASVTHIAGAEHAVEISCQSNLHEHIRTEVKGKRLRIHSKDELRTREPIRITVTAPNLSGVSIAGSGEFDTEELLQGDQIDLAIAGSGRINAAVRSDRLDAKISGSGKMELSGSAQDARIKVAGSGKIRAADLQAETVAADIAGSGRVEVHADGELRGKIAGSGKILHSGAAQPSVKVAGSGSVKRIDKD